MLFCVVVCGNIYAIGGVFNAVGGIHYLRGRRICPARKCGTKKDDANECAVAIER